MNTTAAIFSSGRLWILVFLAAASALPAFAAPPTVPADSSAALALAAAQRDLEIARLKLRLYDEVEYPTQLRSIENQIKLDEAERASLQRRLDEAEQFAKFSYSGPLVQNIEDYRVALVAVTLRLEDHKEQRYLLQRHRPDQRRLHQLAVEAAQDRVRALSGPVSRFRP